MPTDTDPIQRRITEVARSAWRATKKWAAGTSAAQTEDRGVERLLKLSNEIDRFAKWLKRELDKVEAYIKSRPQREAFMQTNSNKDGNGPESKKGSLLSLGGILRILAGDSTGDRFDDKIKSSEGRAIEQKNEQQADIVEEAARAVWKTIKHPVILTLIVLTASVIVTHNYTFFWKSRSFKDAHADAIARGNRRNTQSLMPKR